MSMIRIGLFLLGTLLLNSCSRPEPPTAPAARASGESVELHVADLEEYVTTNAPGPRLSKEEAQKQYRQDFAEIKSMGLVERAAQDFTSRMPGANVERWTIGYFVDTNVVWCEVRYRIPASSETLQQEFGYSRKTGTNWSLIWKSEDIGSQVP